MEVKIEPLKKQDIEKVALIAASCFSGLKDIKKARQWVFCNFRAFPRMRYFTAKKGREVIGYIFWLEKGGFRKEVVFELEQIAVKEVFRGRGVGALLIEQSFKILQKKLKKRGAKLKLVEITTGTENQAQRLYKKALGAQAQVVLKDFFRGDELIMLARF